MCLLSLQVKKRRLLLIEMLSEEISQKLLRAPQVASGLLCNSRALSLEDVATRDYGTLLVNIIQMLHMVTPSALPCMPLHIQVNCDRILDRQKVLVFSAV